MAQLTVRGVPDDVMSSLREEAERRGVSVNAVVRELLAERARESRERQRRAEVIKRMDALREQIREEHGGDLSESWPLIREDRDTR